MQRTGDRAARGSRGRRRASVYCAGAARVVNSESHKIGMAGKEGSVKQRVKKVAELPRRAHDILGSQGPRDRGFGSGSGCWLGKVVDCGWASDSQDGCGGRGKFKVVKGKVGSRGRRSSHKKKARRERASKQAERASERDDHTHGKAPSAEHVEEWTVSSLVSSAVESPVGRTLEME